MKKDKKKSNPKKVLPVQTHGRSYSSVPVADLFVGAPPTIVRVDLVENSEKSNEKSKASNICDKKSGDLLDKLLCEV